MKMYYCHDDFQSGLTCQYRTSGGMCNGGWLCACAHKSTTPPYRRLTMPPVKSPKRKSTSCSSCEHFDVCELKKKFKELKAKNYPLVCECEKYRASNPLLEV